MKRSHLRCAVLVAALAASAGVVAPSAFAQRADSSESLPRYRARLLGVYDELSGEPVPGVAVIDVLSGMSSLTTATGTVSLIFLPDGGSLVRLKKIGYETQTLKVGISATETSPVTLMMQRVTQLPTVVTTDAAPHYLSPALRGFLERQKTEMGRFINEDELRKNDGMPLSNLLRSHAPGAKFAEGFHGSMYLLASAQCVAGGPPQVYLDGVPLQPDWAAQPKSVASSPQTTKGPPPPTRTPTDADAAAPFDLSRYQVSDLAGVEWYADNDMAPIEFAHTSKRCGMLLLWTRER